MAHTTPAHGTAYHEIAGPRRRQRRGRCKNAPAIASADGCGGVTDVRRTRTPGLDRSSGTQTRRGRRHRDAPSRRALAANAFARRLPLYPAAIAPNRAPAGSHRRAAHHALGGVAETPEASWWCSCMAGRAAAARPITAAITTRRFCRLIVYDQRGAGQSPHRFGRAHSTNTTPAPDRRSRAPAHAHHRRSSSPGRSSAAPGARPSRSLRRGPSRTAWGLVGPARHFLSAARRRSRWFLHDMRFVFPKACGAHSRGFLPGCGAARDLLRPLPSRRLTDPEPAVHLPAQPTRRAATRAPCSTLLPDPELVAHFDEDARRAALHRPHREAHSLRATIYCLPDNAARSPASRRIRQSCRASIVQGLYDAGVHRSFRQTEPPLRRPEADYHDRAATPRPLGPRAGHRTRGTRRGDDRFRDILD